MSEEDPDTLANQVADLNAHWLAENLWLATEYEKAKAQIQAENERLAEELAAMTEAHDALRDAYEDLLGASAEQSAELARVKAAAMEFLSLSTNVTRAALAEAVGG